MVVWYTSTMNKCKNCLKEIQKDKWGNKRRKFCNRQCFTLWKKNSSEGKEIIKKFLEKNGDMLRGRIGDKNPNYKGLNRKICIQRGYVKVPVENHPFSKQKQGTHSICGMIFEHRLVMERYLNQNDPMHPALLRIKEVGYLSPDWVVHHKDGNRSNNLIGNLEIYLGKHHSGFSITCPHCGKDVSSIN